jgi:hypothetical protein
MISPANNLWLILRRLPVLIAFGLSALSADFSNAAESRLLHLSSETNNPEIKGRALTVEIGDSTRPEFCPEFTISGWNGEASFRVNLNSGKDHEFGRPELMMVNSRVGVSINRDSTVRYQMYQTPDGNFEWEIVINAKPDTNFFAFPIETAGLEFLYQSPLTKEEIAEGFERPDSVIGSYAVYRSGKRGNCLKIIGRDTIRENYQTGKVMHIYRPKVHDSRGWEVWGNLEIDTALKIEVPVDFLKSAVYPITIDPTFGNTAVGASTGYLSNTACNALSGNAAYRHAAGGGETITSYSLYSLTYNSPAYVGFAAYSYLNGSPDSRLADPVTMTVINGSMQWNTTATVSQNMIAGTTYVTAHGEVTPASSIRARFDTETNVVSVHNESSLPETWSQFSTASYRWSEYVTYTTGTVSQSPRRRMSVLGQFGAISGE